MKNGMLQQVLAVSFDCKACQHRMIVRLSAQWSSKRTWEATVQCRECETWHGVKAAIEASPAITDPSYREPPGACF